MKRVIFVIGLSILFQSCWVSRTSRPKLTGYIFDFEDKKPINKCKVGETYTDSNGFYQLKEKRYLQFTGPGMEAPPVFVMEDVEKDGYSSEVISGFNKYGGGMRKGAHWEMDTIFLKLIK